MSWTIAKSLQTLRDEVNARWPNRDKASDGFIGNAAHAASASDHNPNAAGVVCAFDITHDPAGPAGDDLFALLRARQHPDTKYLIWNRTIVRAYDKPGIPAWTPSPYTGADPHTNHIHVSVGVGTDGQSQPPYDDLDPWLTTTEDWLVSAEGDRIIGTLETDLKAVRDEIIGTLQSNIKDTITGGVASLSKADLDAIAKSVNDELARRQAN